MQVWIFVDFYNYARLLAPGWDVNKRRMKGYQARALKEGAKRFHSVHLRKRFDQGNTRYNHKARKEPYSKIKKMLATGEAVYLNGRRVFERVQKQGVVNLVRSGTTERLAEGPTAISAFPTRASVLIRVKDAVAMRPRSDRPDMAKEITFTPADEIEDMRGVIADTYRDLLIADRGHLSKRL